MMGCPLSVLEQILGCQGRDFDRPDLVKHPEGCAPRIAASPAFDLHLEKDELRNHRLVQLPLERGFAHLIHTCSASSRAKVSADEPDA